MLMRKVFYYTIVLLHNNDFSEKSSKRYFNTMINYPLNPTNPKYPDGVRSHVGEILMDEISRYYLNFSDSISDISKSTTSILRPFLHFISQTQNSRIFKIFLKEVIEFPFSSYELEEQEFEDPSLSPLLISMGSQFLTYLKSSISDISFDINKINEFEQVYDHYYEDFPESLDSYLSTKNDSIDKSNEHSIENSIENELTNGIHSSDHPETPLAEESISKSPSSNKKSKKAHSKNNSISESPLNEPHFEYIAPPLNTTPITKPDSTANKSKRKLSLESQHNGNSNISSPDSETSKSSRKSKKLKRAKEFTVSPKSDTKPLSVQESITPKQSKTPSSDMKTPNSDAINDISTPTEKKFTWALERNSTKRFQKKVPISPMVQEIDFSITPKRSALKKHSSYDSKDSDITPSKKKKSPKTKASAMVLANLKNN
ncbi:hypothetical protein AYI70_g2805 [Smittium culicis]|uniref:Uncharacterized protein n=1 Tax=Smittium culicis TaxID=133412 RepID=A0A1R1Y6I5_9FUNG|nr:hypothetical protein AYI70_g2805 [Smittium culicis]